MRFEFSNKEEREAWRVIWELGDKHESLCDLKWSETIGELSDAASRFDAREKTCGIKPLSEEHFALGCASGTYIHAREIVPEHALYTHLLRNGLVILQSAHNGYRATDKGREVLANLNAMCKVQS